MMQVLRDPQGTKPAIYLMSQAFYKVPPWKWVCVSRMRIGYGMTPSEAYRNWKA